jgi:hypothetical protein
MSSVAPEATGLGFGAGAGVLTANPIVGVAVGLAARLATAEAIGYVQGEQQKQVHIAIAAASGTAPLETPVRWETTPNTVYDTLFGTIRGQALVMREFGQRIRCREIVYTVEADAGGIGDVVAVVDATAADVPGDGEAAGVDLPSSLLGNSPLLAAVVCRGELGWQWAVSAPAAAAP